MDVFYFAVLVPAHVLFTDEGRIEKKAYLNTWKEIPEQNETQFSISGVSLSSGKNSG